MKSVALVAFLILFSSSISACVLSYESYPNNLRSLMYGADGVYLAELVEAKVQERRYKYIFLVKQTLQGVNKKKISVNVDNSLPGGIRNIEQHANIDFWLNPAFGGTKVDSDCKVRPSFNLGREYLVVLGGNETVKNYELIINKEDRWFKFASNPSLPIFSNSDLLELVSGVDIYSCSQERKLLNQREQLLVKTAYGKSHDALWPDNIFKLCSNQNEFYAQVSFKNSESVVHVKYMEDGVLNFGEIINGFEISPFNKLFLP